MNRKFYALPLLLLFGFMTAQAAPVLCVAEGRVVSEVDGVKANCCTNLVAQAVDSSGTESCFKKDTSVTDNSIQACAKDADCGGGTGCFPQTQEDVFASEKGLTETEEEQREMAREKMDLQLVELLGESGELKTNGRSCTVNAECESYNCVSKKHGAIFIKTCEEKLICRLAQENEVAIGNVQCADDLKKQGSVCKSANGLYNGLLGKVELITDPANECRMEIPQEAILAGKKSMETIRAMEMLFARISMSDREDCFNFVNPILKEKVGQKLSAARKIIVQEFNRDWEQIKKDYETLKAATDASDTALDKAVEKYGSKVTTEQIGVIKDKEGNGKVDRSQVVKLHGVETTIGELQNRTATGFDALIMMKRRTLLSQQYEKKMNTAMMAAANELAALGNSMKGWDQNSKDWSITTADGTRTGYSERSCRPWIWANKRRKVHDRWGMNYKVNGLRSFDLAKSEKFMEHLAQMAGNDKSVALRDLNTFQYFMMDPLIPAPKNYDDYGSGIFLRSSNKHRKLNGGNHTLLKIKADFPIMAAQYTREFNPENKANYLYEPELVAITDVELNKKMENNCLANFDHSDCKEIKEYINNISDISFAQFWAFSRTNKRNYKNYFTNDDSWRNRLFRYYGVNFANLKSYYDALALYRDKQVKCIDKRLGVVTEDKTIIDSGLKPGLANDYWKPIDSQLNLGSPKAVEKIETGLALKGNILDLKMGSLSGIGGNVSSHSGSITSASLGSGEVDAATSAQFAANVKSMNEKNSKNGGATSFKEANRATLDTMAAKNNALRNSSGSGSSSGSGAGNGSGQNSGAGSGLNGMANGMAKLGDDLEGINANKNGTDEDASKLGAVDSGSQSAAGAAGGKDGFGGLGGIIGQGIGSTDASGSGKGDYQDPTGMSDEEKERLMANYNRTRGQYNPNDDDSLFKVVSKAYVRNLDKVLTKKKRDVELVK